MTVVVALRTICVIRPTLGKIHSSFVQHLKWQKEMVHFLFLVDKVFKLVNMSRKLSICNNCFKRLRIIGVQKDEKFESLLKKGERNRNFKIRA